MKKKHRKLQLGAETVRALGVRELRAVSGGEAPQSTDEMTICPAGPSVAPARCASINDCPHLTNTCNGWCV